MVDRIKVVCLNCGKRWMGKADSKRWKCTQCGSTKVKPLQALKELAGENKDITNEVEIPVSREIQDEKEGIHTENQPEKNAKNAESGEKDSSQNVKKKEESKDKQDEGQKPNGKIGLGWLLLIPLLILAGYYLLKSLWDGEEKAEKKESEHTKPFSRRPF